MSEEDENKNKSDLATNLVLYHILSSSDSKPATPSDPSLGYNENSKYGVLILIGLALLGWLADKQHNRVRKEQIEKEKTVYEERLNREEQRKREDNLRRGIFIKTPTKSSDSNAEPSQFSILPTPYAVAVEQVTLPFYDLKGKPGTLPEKTVFHIHGIQGDKAIVVAPFVKHPLVRYLEEFKVPVASLTPADDAMGNISKTPEERAAAAAQLAEKEKPVDTNTAPTQSVTFSTPYALTKKKTVILNYSVNGKHLILPEWTKLVVISVNGDEATVSSYHPIKSLGLRTQDVFTVSVNSLTPEEEELKAPLSSLTPADDAQGNIKPKGGEAEKTEKQAAPTGQETEQKTGIQQTGKKLSALEPTAPGSEPPKFGASFSAHPLRSYALT